MLTFGVVFVQVSAFIGAACLPVSFSACLLVRSLTCSLACLIINATKFI